MNRFAYAVLTVTAITVAFGLYTLVGAVPAGAGDGQGKEKVSPLKGDQPAPGGQAKGDAGIRGSVDAFTTARNQLQKEASLSIKIQPGSETEAKDYYQRISGAGVLNFSFEGSTLDGLLAYLGYSAPADGGNKSAFAGLAARDLEKLSSFTLMPRTADEFAELKRQVDNPAAFDTLLDLDDFLDGKVLVSRFFAPKIATYYDKQDPFRSINPDEVEPGWRKLIRLVARPGSVADRAKVLHLYLLFNVKQSLADLEGNPFAKESANNQVILVPRDQDAKDSAYFAVYGPGSLGYKIGYFLGADFDLPGHVGVRGSAADSKYFVPRACAECHGHSDTAFVGIQGRPLDASGQPTNDFKNGVYRFAKPNYLDTDQWYDWMEFDFRGVTTSRNDAIFDGGKSHGSPEYDRAMRVVRTLNKTIGDQTFNAERQRGTKTFSTLAAEKWQKLHDTDLQRAPYPVRSIGNEQWDTTKVDEMRLLRLLDNHCFRCHSSTIYNVFDREAVRVRKRAIQVYLELPVKDKDNNVLPGFFMPQGRVLRNEERAEIIRLLNTVFP